MTEKNTREIVSNLINKAFEFDKDERTASEFVLYLLDNYVVVNHNYEERLKQIRAAETEARKVTEIETQVRREELNKEIKQRYASEVKNYTFKNEEIKKTQEKIRLNVAHREWNEMLDKPTDLYLDINGYKYSIEEYGTKAIRDPSWRKLVTDKFKRLNAEKLNTKIEQEINNPLIKINDMVDNFKAKYGEGTELTDENLKDLHLTSREYSSFVKEFNRRKQVQKELDELNDALLKIEKNNDDIFTKFIDFRKEHSSTSFNWWKENILDTESKQLEGTNQDISTLKKISTETELVNEINIDSLRDKFKNIENFLDKYKKTGISAKMNDDDLKNWVELTNKTFSDPCYQEYTGLTESENCSPSNNSTKADNFLLLEKAITKLCDSGIISKPTTEELAGLITNLTNSLDEDLKAKVAEKKLITGPYVYTADGHSHIRNH